MSSFLSRYSDIYIDIILIMVSDIALFARIIHRYSQQSMIVWEVALVAVDYTVRVHILLFVF